MLSVPRALTSKSVFGSTSDVVTATWPARWRMASWSRTCSARASAFLTSSLTNDVRFGYRVISHLRLRSVPGRLRLSRRVTCQPSLIRCAAAFTPRNPAPPVMRMRRSGLSVSGSSLSVTYRAFGSMVPHTLSRRYAPEERNRDDPRCAGEDEGFAPGVVAARVGVRPRDEEGRERAVDHVQQARRGVAARNQGKDAEHALHRGEAGHDHVRRAEAAAQSLVAEVVVGAPQAENDREHHEDASAVGVEKCEDVEPADLSQLRLETGDLLAEVVDRQAQALLELDLRAPSEMLSGARVVERDPVHVALARRAKPRLEPVLGQERELAKQCIHPDWASGPDVVRSHSACTTARLWCG